MGKNVFYHNPRCRKSREGLKLIQNKTADFEIVEYQKNPPTKEELKFILTNLKIHPLQLIRTKEKLFKQLNLSKKDDRSVAEWIELLVQHPILIERPIFVYNGKVAVGRPAENLLEIL